jgi:hypothetical protein
MGRGWWGGGGGGRESENKKEKENRKLGKRSEIGRAVIMFSTSCPYLIRPIQCAV